MIFRARPQCPLVKDTIQDFDGYLAFLEDPSCGSQEDYNDTRADKDGRSRYANFNLKLRSALVR
jgi:hypothetical protein